MVINKLQRFTTILIVVIISALIVSCGERKITIENRVIVSIAPLKPLVEGILGDDFEVVVLVPQGASPETFEPTPKQLREVESARFVFGTGLLEFEQELIHRVARNEQIINLSQGIDVIAGSCSHAHHKHSHDHTHGIDPHIWCSPKSLLKMTQNIYSAITTEMPDSMKYKMTYNDLYIKIADLHKEVADKCWKEPHTAFMIYHPALTYLARDYGLKQIVIENEGKEPSAKHIANIIEQARQKGIKYVFYQSEFPASSVEIICKDINATAVEINPLAEDVVENIRHITTLITE